MPPSWGCLCSKECYLDPSVAMVIRDTPCDFITLEAIMISVWFSCQSLSCKELSQATDIARIWNHGITKSLLHLSGLFVSAFEPFLYRKKEILPTAISSQLSGWDQHPDDHCHECANILFGSDGFHKNYSSPGTMTRHLSKNFSMTVSVSSRVNLLAGF